MISIINTSGTRYDCWWLKLCPIRLEKHVVQPLGFWSNRSRSTCQLLTNYLFHEIPITISKYQFFLVWVENLNFPYIICNLNLLMLKFLYLKTEDFFFTRPEVFMPESRGSSEMSIYIYHREMMWDAIKLWFGNSYQYFCKIIIAIWRPYRPILIKFLTFYLLMYFQLPCRNIKTEPQQQKLTQHKH